LMGALESVCQYSEFQDHFFHTFQNFLLGCIVVDNAKEHFVEFLESFFGAQGNLIPEHVWVLTALFHDVGYSAQRKAELDGYIMGIQENIDPLTGSVVGTPESVNLNLSFCWDNDRTRSACNNLVHLFNHLNALSPVTPWEINHRFEDEHPFRNALRANYNPPCHGVHSAFRLLLETFSRLASYSGQRVSPRVEYPHIATAFLAAISIPFHDQAFRTALRKEGISCLKTSRFPFAALLAFIDSIQDDRRQRDVPDPSNDILEGLEVNGKTISACLDVSRLIDAQVLKKRTEATDIISFFEADGLIYEYPPELIS